MIDHAVHKTYANFATLFAFWNHFMNLLALESSTEACSVALEVEGKSYSSFEMAPQEHAQRFLPMIDALVQEGGIKPGDIEGVAYGHGPGSFTGVRIAASIVQGIALGCDALAVGVSTLQAIAYRVWRETGQTKILAAMDARMGEVYWGGYQFDQFGQSTLVVKEAVAVPEAVELPTDSGWVGAGSGWKEYEIRLLHTCGEVCLRSLGVVYPSAEDVLKIAKPRFLSKCGVNPEDAMPVYLRNKVALTEEERAQLKKK